MAATASTHPVGLKIVLVGDGGVGKTTLVTRIRRGYFESRYIATLGVEVHPIMFYTTRGVFILNVWDTAGQEKFGGLRDGYYIGANGCIAMADATSVPTVRSIPKWLTSVARVAGDIPVVLALNKCDLPEKPEVSQLLPGEPVRLSTKSTDNIDGPFQALLRYLTGHEDLEITDGPPLAPEVSE